MSQVKTPVNDYAPGAKALGHVSKVTCEAVHTIGKTAADEIEEAARVLEEEAKFIADELRELSAALKEQGKYHADRVSAFGEKAADVSQTIKELRAKITEGSFVKADLADDGKPTPSFLHESPHWGVDRNQTPLPQAAE
jgi:DNA anti-recombination protein RmuC